MDGATELTMWHVQCIHSPLRTPEGISDYITGANLLLKHIWKSPEEAAPTPPQLQVDAVENSVVTHRGASIDAVRLRFKLPPKHQGNNDRFFSAIRYFCEKIFKLKVEGELDCHISFMSPRSLIGIEPLSPWFRLCWTQGFLETFIHRRVPLFDELAGGEFFWPWLGGVVYIVLALEQKPSEILRATKIALAKNFDIEAKRPPEDLENRSKKLSKAFLRSVETVLIRLDSTIEACSKYIDQDATQLPSDSEIRLFDAVLKLFQAGFEVLTINKEVFDEWENIVSSAAGKLYAASSTTALSLVLFGWQAIAAKTAAGGAATATAATAAAAAGAATTTAAAAGAATANAAAGGTATAAAAVGGAASAAAASAATTTAAGAGAGAAGAGAGATGAGAASMWSLAVLGPLALLAGSSILLILHNRNHNKAKEERDKIKKLSEGIQGHYEIARYLAQWFISGYRPAHEDEGTQMKDMRAQLGKRGLMPTLSLRDYKAGISSEADVIRQQLQKMRADPDLKDYFS